MYSSIIYSFQFMLYSVSYVIVLGELEVSSIALGKVHVSVEGSIGTVLLKA